MGTRSTTKFIEVWKDPQTQKPKKQTLMAMYRQMDGYPSGHGIDLAKFLKKGKLVNGLSLGNKERVFNGMGCLAAQVVKHLKKGPGSIYITNINDQQQYNYEIIGDFDTHEITLVCKDSDNKVLFKGDPKDFEKFAKKYGQ